MALPDSDISVGHSFGLEFDGVTIKQITEVSGLQIDQDVVELKQGPGTGKLLVRKLPGRPKAGEVTLTRGLAHGDSFETWIRPPGSGSCRTPGRAARSSSTTTRAPRSGGSSSPTPA
jgi:phage tail-like protein